MGLDHLDAHRRPRIRVSAGGPLIFSGGSSLCLTPICPAQCLNYRPLVVPDPSVNSRDSRDPGMRACISQSMDQVLDPIREAWTWWCAIARIFQTRAT